MSLVVSKIQRTSIAILGPHELRERVGRGETAATSTSRASSLLQARFDEGCGGNLFRRTLKEAWQERGKSVVNKIYKISARRARR